MKTFLPSSLYNYYPRTAISLCITSYLDYKYVPSQVLALGLDVVWGPARKLSLLDIPYSFMLIARNPISKEYWVVIRGTDPASLTSWIKEDFDVGSTEQFLQYAPSAPAEARISTGTSNGLSDLLSLTDPNTGLTAIDFLKQHQQDIRFLYVTGHSLGGTLTPPMFAYLNEALFTGKAPDNMALWSFAGLTSGNAAFAAYIDELTQCTYDWRFHNPMDVAPLLFEDEEKVQNLYSPKLDWHAMDFVFRGLIEHLFNDAQGKGYQQPQGEYLLEQSFNASIDNWLGQASYQHHAGTYQQLVYEQFPLGFPVGA